MYVWKKDLVVGKEKWESTFRKTKYWHDTLELENSYEFHLLDAKNRSNNITFTDYILKVPRIFLNLNNYFQLSRSILFCVTFFLHFLKIKFILSFTYSSFRLSSSSSCRFDEIAVSSTNAVSFSLSLWSFGDVIKQRPQWTNKAPTNSFENIFSSSSSFVVSSFSSSFIIISINIFSPSSAAFAATLLHKGMARYLLLKRLFWNLLSSIHSTKINYLHYRAL